LNSCQIIARQNRSFSPSYCAGILLQKVCEKFEFLSNNCSSQKGLFYHSIVQAICFKKPVKVSILVKQLFGKKDLFFHTGNMLQKTFGSKQFVKHLKKSLKNLGNFPPIACTIVKQFIDTYQAHKYSCADL
jgi:hypothetical protein